MPDYKDLTPAHIVDLYKTQDIPSLEISKIRTDLELGNVAEEDIQIVLNSVGIEKDKALHHSAKKDAARQQVWIGLGLLIAALVLTVLLWSKGFLSALSLILAVGGLVYLAKGLNNK